MMTSDASPEVGLFEESSECRLSSFPDTEAGHWSRSPSVPNPHFQSRFSYKAQVNQFADEEPFDLLVFSHLRWNFVFQRPQHLLSRSAAERRTFFVEEPRFDVGMKPKLIREKTPSGVTVIVPHLPTGTSEGDCIELQAVMLEELLRTESISQFVSWYYTPMAVSFTRSLRPRAVVYDCMDELSHFKGAPVSLKILEGELFGLADLVFTGGHSLYEAKAGLHSNIHPIPSSVDVAHFKRARCWTKEPADQASIHGTRIGFFGVIDERFDADLIAAMARLRPNWQLILIGPVVKIEAADLPRAPNIHYLGSKDYQDLPAYLAGWDLAMMPFQLNDATRYISPTKTPEYLAAGRPVVSTAIRDVIRPYGELGLVRIGRGVDHFIEQAERAMIDQQTDAGWLARVDQFLANVSWDRTWQQMREHMSQAVSARMPQRGSLN